MENEMRGVGSTLHCYDRNYYRPDLCPREPRIKSVPDVIDFNHSLARLEPILLFAGFNIGEARIIIALLIYERLGARDLLRLTGMKQSAVSRSLDTLNYHGHLLVRVGKDKGRPYQVYSLKYTPKEVVAMMKDRLKEREDDLDVLMDVLELSE